MEIAISIAGLIIAWLTFIKTFHSEPTEEKDNLLALFKATQKLSKELSEIMTNYAEKRDAFEIELYQGITYSNYINALKHSQLTNLSDELFNKLVDLKLTKSNIASMQKSLEAQFEDLQKMKSMFIMAEN